MTTLRCHCRVFIANHSILSTASFFSLYLWIMYLREHVNSGIDFQLWLFPLLLKRVNFKSIPSTHVVLSAAHNSSIARLITLPQLSPKLNLPLIALTFFQGYSRYIKCWFFFAQVTCNVVSSFPIIPDLLHMHTHSSSRPFLPIFISGIISHISRVELVHISIFFQMCFPSTCMAF